MHRGDRGIALTSLGILLEPKAPLITSRKSLRDVLDRYAGFGCDLVETVAFAQCGITGER